MREYVASFSDSPFVKRIVNKDIIEARNNQKILAHIDNLYKEMEKQLGGDMQYLGYNVNDKHSQVREINKSRNKSKKSFQGTLLSTDETLARAYEFNFRLKFKDETIETSSTIYVPIVCDDGINYIIKGNKYCIPFQLIDSVTYSKTDSKGKYDEVCLKTSSFQDIKMRRYPIIIEDIFGTPHSCNTYNIVLNKRVNKVPFLLFYFATFGIYNTLKYFGLSNWYVGVKIFKEIPDENHECHKNYLFFKFGTLYISVHKMVFKKEPLVRDLIATILKTKKGRSINEENISKVDYWTIALGAHLGGNNTLSHGVSLKTTFYNSLDITTVDTINTFVGKELKSIYAVVRWMFYNYSHNLSKDMSLVNKRLRLSEYIIDPLKQHLRQKCYSYNGTRGGYRDMSRLEGAVLVNPFIILDAITGRSNRGVNTGKFSNSVNDFSIYNSITKASQTGPGSVNSSSAYIPDSFKKLHHSMIGRVDLISTGANNAGSSFRLLPNCSINSETLGFTRLYDIDE